MREGLILFEAKIAKLNTIKTKVIKKRIFDNIKSSIKFCIHDFKRETFFALTTKNEANLSQSSPRVLGAYV